VPQVSPMGRTVVASRAGSSPIVLRARPFYSCSAHSAPGFHVLPVRRAPGFRFLLCVMPTRPKRVPEAVDTTQARYVVLTAVARDRLAVPRASLFTGTMAC